MHKVTVYGSKPEKVSKHLTIINEHGDEIHYGDIVYKTSDEKTAFENAELIFITMPAYCMNYIAEKIYPLINKNMKIRLVLRTGGGECPFKSFLEKGATIFGL